MMLSPTSLQAYIDTFLGYGNPEAKFVFVGLEEGGDAATIAKRVEQWNKLGATPLVDIVRMHEGLPGGMKWFSKRPPIQRTWGRLIRILLAAKSLSSTNDDIRNYQRDSLGRSVGDTALLELMPLPSRRISEWNHQHLSLPELSSRERYVDAFQPLRVDRIKAFIGAEPRRAVIFYGKRTLWPSILDIDAPSSKGFFDAGSIGGVPAIFCDHPTARGTRNSQFAEIGAWLAQRIR